jgi:transcriptional regulator with XRE-family HTH domain
MRPTRYKKEFAEQVKKLCRLGATDKELADFFEVTETTINNWKLRHKEFLESIKEGKLLADAEVADKLYHRALGYTTKDTKFATHEGEITDEREYDKHYPPDTVAAIFWLKNRQPEKWRDKQEVDVNMPTVKVRRKRYDGGD